MDVTNDQQVEATFQSLYDHEQRLDLVINNAGTFSTGKSYVCVVASLFGFRVIFGMYRPSST